jgi:hypothetical protein
MKAVADVADNSVFQGGNSPDDCICYDFKDLTIRPTHYSLRARYSRDSNYSLNDSMIEGSNDGKSRAEFDRRGHNREMDAMNAVKLFQMSRSDEVRMIVLRQLKKRGSSIYFCHIVRIEAFLPRLHENQIPTPFSTVSKPLSPKFLSVIWSYFDQETRLRRIGPPFYFLYSGNFALKFSAIILSCWHFVSNPIQKY